MDQAKPVGRIDVISDVICPWCYIGKRQLERALDLLEKQHLRFTVAWHPFQLNPDMPREGVDRAQYRIAKFGSARALAPARRAHHRDRRHGGPGVPSRPADPHAQHADAHRLIRFAGQKGVQDGVVEALFEGYFCNGADIGDDERAGQAR